MDTNKESVFIMNFCTPYIWVNILIFIAGLCFLIKGSDLFIDSAAKIARKYNVSELVIGLTLVSIGTSLPEWASSVYATIKNQPEFVIGNVVGSCSTNITLILGLALLVKGNMPFSPKLLTRDGIVMLTIYVATIIMTCLCNIDGEHGLNRISGTILLLGAVGYCYMLLRSSKEDILAEANETTPQIQNSSILFAFLFLIIGLIMVLLGSKGMLDTVVWGAKQLNISTILISVTIVAFGTSVPELAVTLAGVLKKKYSLAIGNLIGSCIFNILLIFGTCSVIKPMPISSNSETMNLGLMTFSGALLVLFMRKKTLTRWHGALLFMLYVIFLVYNCRSLINF